MAGTLVIVFPPTEGNRREVCKVTPMMTLRSVLEEACKRGKRPLDAGSFSLFNGKTELDLTLTIRFAGLAGGVKLDAVPRPPGSAPVITAQLPRPTVEAATAPLPAPAQPPHSGAAGLNGEAVNAELSTSAAAAPVDDASGNDMAIEDNASERIAEALVGRRMRVFSRSGLESLPPVDDGSDLGDDFYEFTTEDLHMVMAAAHKPAQPQLLTKELRERLEEERAKSFSRTVLRVQLPDGHVVESTFSPTDTLKDLLNAVVSACEPGLKLYLFTAPPKERLGPLDKTLHKAGLVPAARVFAGIEAEKDEGREAGKPLLLQSLLDLVDADLPRLRATREAAAAQRAAQRQAEEAAAAAAAERRAGREAAGASSSGGAVASGEEGAAVVDDEGLRKKLSAGGKPKWMKL